MLVDLGNPMPKRLRNVFSQLCHRHLGSSSKMELVMEALYASTGSFAPTSNDFRWVPPWDCLFGQKRLASLPFFKFLGMCKCSNISDQHTIKLMFTHFNSMCKRSNIFFLYGSMQGRY